MKNNKKIAILFVILQGLFTIASVIAVIVYFFQPKVKVFLPFFFGITLLSLAFNNYMIYHKKFFTLIYLVFGLLCMMYGFMGG